MRISKRSRMGGMVFGVLLLMLALAVVGCGGSSDETTTTTAAPTTTTAAAVSSDTTAGSASSGTTVALTGDAAVIAENWTTFFDGSQPVDGKAALLENGDQYSKELEAQAASALAQAATVQVKNVTITSDTTADVTYDLVVAGTTALPDQVGQAVLQDGVWKVSAASFEALLALQGGTTGASTGN